MAQLDVLITAASRRVALVRGFQSALQEHGVHGRVLVTDVNPLSPAVHFADAAFRVPMAGDVGYVDALRSLCRAEGVGLLVPTIDDELPILAGARGRFEDDGVQVAVSPVETTTVCNDKHATCLHLRRSGVRAATSYLPGDVPSPPPLPLFVKPRFGRGGVGAFHVCRESELEFFLAYVPDPVVEEYLDGPEYTIDVLCDFDGAALAVVPRERVVIRAGVFDRGRTVADPRLIDLGLACARAIRFAGAVNIQCRIVDGTPVVFEINPRFSGGIPLTIAAGAHFPAMLVQLALGRSVAPAVGRFRDGLWMTCYEAGIYLPDGDADRLRPVADQPALQEAG